MDAYFQTLQDAVSLVDHKVNLFAVVIESGFCRKSLGADFYITLRVVDKSHWWYGIPVNFFTENIHELPHVASAGDIIRLTRVTMKVHAGQVYALFNKKFSSFALYKGENGQDLLPYQSSSWFVPVDHLDNDYVEGLRNWFPNFELDKGPENLLSVREIKGGQLDLICKVLHICKFDNGRWMAFVWDGTDALPNRIFKLEDEIDDPLTLEIEPTPLSRDLLGEFPTIGSVIRVIFNQHIENEYLQPHMLSVGKWVILLGIECEVDGELWRGVVKHFSKVHYIPNQDNIVLNRERQYEERGSQKFGKMPSWSLPWTSRVTEIDHEYAPLATLMDVLTYPEVTMKFRCVVRVVAMMPWLVEDFRNPTGQYRLRLTLEDPTARIHAYVFDTDGEKFFDGYPTHEKLTRKQGKMLGVQIGDNGRIASEAPRNPPWLHCCIKSYYLGKNNPWETRNFCIFDTKLVG